ncbi:MAG: hypothetical protein ACI9LE_000736, partial [Paraglaciecola sp.]
TEFVEGCQGGSILFSIPGIGIINASAFLGVVKGRTRDNTFFPPCLVTKR